MSAPQAVEVVMPEVVPEHATTRVTATGELHHLCPHVDEVDRGSVSIAWTCAGSTLELHALTRYLASFATERISHEALVQAIREDLAGLYGIADVEVTGSWTTAGLDVEVSTRR